ncbi:MAG: type II secretion system protein [Planctomycetota bacterium]
MYSSNLQGRKLAKQRGLTLIELIVVLTILVALGSLLVPVIGSALTRSHVATCSANIPEVFENLQRQFVLTGDYGDNWTTAVVTGTAAGAGNSVNGNTTVALTDGEVDSLNEVGIENVFNHVPDTTTGYIETFNCLDPTVENLAAGSVVILADGADLLPASPANSRYIWLGIDSPWEGIGVVTPEPPTHFGDTPGAYPDEVYSRFGAIFRVYDTGTGDDATPAELIRVTYSLEGGTAFETADNHIGIYWDEVQQ